MDTAATEVFPVWHTHQLDDFEFVRLIGVYSTEQFAHAAARRAASRPGFRDTVEGFFVGGATLGEREWDEGFVSLGMDE